MAALIGKRPFERKFVGRKFFRRRKRQRFLPESKMAIVIAKKALAKVNRINRNIEDKMITAASLSTNIAAAGIVVAQTGVAQGDDFFERIGNKITVIRFSVNGTLFHPSAITETVRIMFFYDTRQVADGTPSVGEVLRVADPLSFMNETTVGRFRILFDQLFAFESSSNDGVAIRFSRQLNLEQRYNGIAANDHEKNMIFMLAVSDATANFPVFRHIARLNFTDS